MSASSFPIRYAISINHLAGHLLDVQLTIDSPDATGQKLTLPAWIPGSYMIRDFAKSLLKLQAKNANGDELALTQLDKQSWQLPAVTGPVTLSYQVYAFDLSVRSAYLDHEFCFFNGTSTFLKVLGQEHLPCHVEIIKPSLAHCAEWRVATTLPTHADTALHSFGDYWAEDYDELVDHPVLMGHYDIVPLAVEGKTFELILAGGHQADCERLSKDLTKICNYEIALFGEFPTERYLFITLLTQDGFGGLEHRSSTALMYSRDNLPGIDQGTSVSDGYRTFLSLCSHELFHTWHVKRIRPQALKEADLTKEAYTNQLWIYEGFTSYYDDLCVYRAGCIDEKSYLELIGQNLTRLCRNAGRLKQSASASSFNAWTKFYQQDASAVNNIVSYYNKGGIIAMCLDLVLRQQSNDEATLDKVMQLLWQHYGKPDIGTDDDIIETLVFRHFGIDIREQVNAFAHSTKELPVSELLEAFGVKTHYRCKQNSKDNGGKPADKTIRHGFGAVIKGAETGVIINQVAEDSPAYQAGIQVGDRLVAIDQWQITPDNLHQVLDRFPTNDNVTAFVLRRNRLHQLLLPIKEAQLDTIYLQIEDLEEARAWLKG